MANPIAFGDFAVREKAARDAATERVFMLKQQEKQDRGLPPQLEAELEVNSRVAGRKNLVDPLYIALRDTLATTNPDMAKVQDHDKGVLQNLQDRDVQFAAIYGLLSLENHVPRDFTWELEQQAGGKKKLVFTTSDGRFRREVAKAQGEYSEHVELFQKTLPIIIGLSGGRLDSTKWAAVVRKLANSRIPASHENLALLTEEALAEQIGVTDGTAPSSIELDFPDLDSATDVQIVVNNIKAMKIFYPSWMLDEARFYDVYEKVEELFLNQMLPISRGTAGDQIYKRWKKSTQRISKGERLNFYATCFGAANGNPAITNQNREFYDLWLRLVSSVSEFGRKLQVDDLLRTRIPLSVSSEAVRKAARDLAANLSLHGYGVAYFAATELQNEINEIKDILSDEEVRLAYGARDMRQLIEQVSIYELGGARDVTRYFTMATSGAVIIAWLAKKAPDLSGSYLTPILDINVVRKPTLRQPTVKATRDPTDRDLVDACEQWLAVTGTPDDRVSEFAQPNETPAMTSRPVAIPQVARDLLDQVGVSAGLQGGNGGGSRYAVRR